MHTEARVAIEQLRGGLAGCSIDMEDAWRTVGFDDLDIIAVWHEGEVEDLVVELLWQTLDLGC